MIALVVALASLATAPAFACVKNADCTAPNTCHFAAGLAEGQCIDTSQMAVVAGEKNRSSQRLKDRKAGDVCQFAVDCAAGMTCYKAPGTAEGKCYASR